MEPTSSDGSLDCCSRPYMRTPSRNISGYSQRNRKSSLALVQDPLDIVRKVHEIGFIGHTSRVELLFELLEQPVFLAAMGELEEITVEVRQLTWTEVSLALDRVPFQVLGALSEDLAGIDVVLHDGLHPIPLNGADYHADRAAVVRDHYRAAAVVD